MNSKLARTAGPDKSYLRCSICNQLIKQSEIEIHKQSCFKEKKQNDAYRPISKSKSTQAKNDQKKNIVTSHKKSSTPNQPTRLQNHPTDASNQASAFSHDGKQLDATYCQHVFRERGRFGSAASHDNYDDESKP